MIKRDLILFSGGLDSTSVVADYVNKGKPFDILYVDGGQHRGKKALEEEAVRSIMSELKQLHPELSYKHYTASANWLNSVTPYGSHPAFSQTPAWLFAALRAYEPERHEAVVLSYVLGDDISYSLSAVKKAWSALTILTWDTEVPIKLPLVTFNKSYLLKMMPLWLFKLIWICEMPTDGRRCGICSACNKMDQVFLVETSTSVWDKLGHWNSTLNPKLTPRVPYINSLGELDDSVENVKLMETLDAVDDNIA